MIPRGRLWCYAVALAAADAFYWVFHLLYTQWADYVPINQGPQPFDRAAHITLATLAALLIVAIFLGRFTDPAHDASFFRRSVLLVALLVFFCLHWQMWDMCQRAPWLYVEDVGRTTVAADRLVLHGHDPYSAPLDARAESWFPGEHLDGYKYLPVMMAAYLPALLCKSGDWGVLAMNLAFSVAAAAVLAMCLWKWISLDAALYGAMLFFMPRILTEENFRHGNNDTAPMILLLLSLYLIDLRFTCGLLVGLAISAKLLPGLLWIPICLTAARRRRYLGGVVAGVAVCLPFFVVGPRDFVNNVVLFTLRRPVEGTSLTANLPPWTGWALRLPVLAAILVLGFYAWKREMPPIRRCAWAAVLALAVQLTAPMVHPNYFVWWVMPLTVAVTAAVFSYRLSPRGQ